MPSATSEQTRAVLVTSAVSHEWANPTFYLLLLLRLCHLLPVLRGGDLQLSLEFCDLLPESVDVVCQIGGRVLNVVVDRTRGRGLRNGLVQTNLQRPTVEYTNWK